MFKALSPFGEVVGRYGLFDLGAGTVDQVSLEDVLKEGAVDFVYFYDVTNRKFVLISVEGEVENDSLEHPVLLVDSKGPNPVEFENGYIAFEVLPPAERHLPGEEGDDEDFDEGEPEEDDEEGKEIYDENE